MKKRFVKILIGFIGCITLSALADVRRVWDEKPLTLVLPVNQEIRVIFPTDVDVQVPMGIGERLQSLAPNTRMIFWTATEIFDPARIIATAKDGKTVYILDVAAQTNAYLEDVVIEDPARQTFDDTSLTEAEEDLPVDTPLDDPAEIILTRFASQTLYAPSRLIPADDRIMVVTPPSIPNEFPLLQSAQGERFSVQVVGAWMGFGRYVTAVLAINKTPLRFQLDLSRVRGNFTHISAQHLMIGAAGSLEDRTTLYLISSQPFNEALLEDSYAY